MSRRMIVAIVLLLSLCFHTVSASPLLSSNELVFVNVDHAPMGLCSTINYGYKGPTCGVGMSSGAIPYLSSPGGVLFALSDPSGLQLLPFLSSAASVSTNARYFPDASVQRTLTPCTDEFTIAGGGLTFTHYSPAWLMPELATATSTEKRRYFLPATWLAFTLHNTNTTPEDFYFGLPVPVNQRTFANGAYQGFALGEAALAVQTGSCELLSGTGLKAVLEGMTQGGVFHLGVPAGQTRTLLVVIAYYRQAVVDSRISAFYYYTSLYPSIDSVIDSAFAGFGDTQLRCQQMATAMSQARLNPYRQFLASHALHSYMADTACLLDPQGGVHWREMEGHYNYINTFDLTVDHAFFDSLLHPWALRNVLDRFSGALPGNGYSYDTPLYSSTSGTIVSSHGYSFYHDIGLWPTSGTGPAYGACMGQEELQTWILSAGLYWSQTADHPWLTNNQAVLQACLDSMLLRDSTNAAARDGITKNVNGGEITTFDDLDGSLRVPAYSGRLAVRNWACYLALDAMFRQIGATAQALTCENMAGTAAQTIVDRWNSYRGSLGYIPALLNGSDTAATIPMIEGLAYPAAMGLTNAIDRTGGPYAAMLQALSNHIRAVLVPGRCLHGTSGAWMMTSANLNTWQSKNYLCQYSAEVVLGITNNTVNGTVDQVHATIQIGDAPYQGWADQLDGSGANGFSGSDHYPRGITSALWWMNASNNPAYPIATSAPVAPAVFSALATNQQVLLLWQGVSLANGYNLKRSTRSGGPYTTLTNLVSGASFIDSKLTNGTTYYYILTATNGLGESLPSPEVSATPVPSTGPNLIASINGLELQISWPTEYIGWILQTNIFNLASPGGWGDVPASRTNSQMAFPVTNPSVPAGFFRLRHP